jgi:hypothetical protein
MDTGEEIKNYGMIYYMYQSNEESPDYHSGVFLLGQKITGLPCI